MDALTTNTNIKNLLSEKEKEDKDYLMKMTDSTITELVKDKDQVRKAYNYYNGIRDKDQFRHLEEIYGLGTPTSIEFIPLVRPHIDLLVGELLQIPFKPQVTCKDKTTLTNINKDKQAKIAEEMFNAVKLTVNNTFTKLLMESEGQAPGEKTNPYMEKELTQIRDEYERSFISEYEISVQYLLEHIKQNHHIDFLNKRKELFKSLLIAGQCYYNINKDKKGALPELEVLHPMSVWVENNPNNPYLNKSTRAVIRRKMSRQEILLRYGHLLTKEDIEKIESYIIDREDGNVYYMTSNDEGIIAGVTPTIVGGSPAYPDNWFNWFYKDLLSVYEVQFLAANKYTDADGTVRYRLDRYETIRINEDIYILKGKAVDITRDMESVDDLYLTIGGICYSDINGAPYSLMLATAHLQDKYDILHFHRDTLILLSGVKGTGIETSAIPAWLGEEPEERLKKFIAYKKAGTAPLDTLQEGVTNMNTAIFVPYDDTLSGQGLTAIQTAIQLTEESCSRITGVFRERLGAIEQKDAVTNVLTGIRQSAIITKQYFQTIDLITREILINYINACRFTLTDGFMGSIILGNKLSKVFEIKPEHFSFTSYDIHLDDSGDIVRDMQKIELFSLELVKGGLVDVDVLLSAIGTHSMTQMKHEVLASYEKKKKENSQIQTLNQQLLQTQEELKKIQQEFLKLSAENELLKKQDKELIKYKIDKEYDLGVKRLDVDSKFNTQRMKLEQKRVDLEQLQLIDNNPQNDEIKNVG